MMPIVRIAFAALLIAVASLAEAQTEPLGRLFFTPEQRAALDRQRQTGNGQTLADRDLGSSAMVFNGLVSRSGGRSIRWINGVASEGALPSPSGARLKVGDTFDADTGERQDLLHGGQILIRKAPATLK